MNIVLLRGCCLQGIKEMLHLTRYLDQKGIEHNLHVTAKKGKLGRRLLTSEQVLDNNVYIAINDKIEEFNKWFGELQNG